MGATYRPVAGQIVMVEPVGDEATERCLTGVIMASTDERIAVDLGAAGVGLVDGSDVIVSVFSSEAMYRVHGQAHATGRSVVVLDPVFDVERVQRRRSPRPALRLSVTLVSTAESDPDVSRVAGHSLDVSVGGLRVETMHPLPEGADPIVIVSAPEGAPLMLPTRVITSDVGETGCLYRLAFTHLRPGDADRLAVMMGSALAGRD